MIVMFVVVQNMPGNPVETLAADIARLSGLVRGDLGDSIIDQKPVTELVLGALPWTLLVLSGALLLSFAASVLMGVFVAWKRNRVLTVYQSIFGSIPNYIVAYMLVFVLAVALRWLPSRGPYSSAVTPGANWPFVQRMLQHAILPVLAYFLTTVAGWTISMKASALSVLGEDYVAHAQARGLSQRGELFFVK